jgi:hypothetical protein
MLFFPLIYAMIVLLTISSIFAVSPTTISYKYINYKTNNTSIFKTKGTLHFTVPQVFDGVCSDGFSVLLLEC